MKKLTSIVLLSTILFHSGGFYILFWVLRHQATVEMSQRLEETRYSEGETITLKIPLAIPYNGDSHDYQDITGEIESKGEYLRLIKQKFVRDTLYVVCVKDDRKRELTAVMTDFVKSSNDQPTSPAMKLLGSFIRDFVAVTTVEPVIFRTHLSNLSFDTRKCALTSVAMLVESPPPDHLLS